MPTSAQDYTVVAVRRRNGFIRGDQSWCGPLNFGEFVAHQGRHAGHSDCCHRHGLPASWRHRLPELLWEALLRGDDLVTEIPPDRWDADEYYDPEPGVPGRSVSKWGAFIDDVAGFDADFFGISEQEAIAIDPQHRLLLEVSWEAAEHAGLSPARLAGTRTGVYVGLGHNDYQLVAADAHALEGPYGFLGNGYCMGSGGSRMPWGCMVPP
ncbi:beta-ketoacyl synthase, N-terminal domain protein [Mycobacterium xenopi 3993]|nr:beta-ketoacyl synthase, N-terminal domain protein [Mycobacterium xenopi 3993]